MGKPTLSELFASTSGIARSVKTCLSYPRGSEAQVRCLEEIGQDVDRIIAELPPERLTTAAQWHSEQRVATVLKDGTYDGWILKELYSDGHGFHCTFEHPSDNSGLYGDGPTPNEALAHALGKITIPAPREATEAILHARKGEKCPQATGYPDALLTEDAWLVRGSRGTVYITASSAALAIAQYEQPIR